jgi:hypothetical protein
LLERATGAICVALAALCCAAAVAGQPAAKTADVLRLALSPAKPNAVVFPAAQARFVRVLIHESSGGQPCLDELEVYGPNGDENLALSSKGAKAAASSCLPGYAIHQVAHLNDGQYGNACSWIAQGNAGEWAQIELPLATEVAKVILSRDRKGQFQDRLPVRFDVQLSPDGNAWQTIRRVQAPGVAGDVSAIPLPAAATWDALLRYAFLCEQRTWSRVDSSSGLARVLKQMEPMIERLAAKGLDVSAERTALVELLRKEKASAPDADAEQAAYVEARAAKRRLMLRDPDLEPLRRILFVKRHPYEPSHNYSDILDSRFRSGGGVCVLDVPFGAGGLEPANGKVTTLFDATNGIARDCVPDFDAKRVFFAYRPAQKQEGLAAPYWHLMSVNAEGGDARQLTDGPFHDYYPCPLPDGGLAFIATRCTARFLCWRPQVFVLFRMDADGSNIRPLSFANLSEWGPSVMSDGRVIWTRSEYLDKGADFGHTLWAIRPDGSHPELIFGNNTRNCYMNAREVPGTSELCCTLISHGGDLNGPIGLVDISKGPFDATAITNITPDVAPHYHMSWARRECFRDPVPVARDYYLVSHAPSDHFGLYVIDRWGNRELLYMDPAIGSMCPTPLRATPRPPVLSGTTLDTAEKETGQFTVVDIYQGLEPDVQRGSVKYLRVCQEVRAELSRLPNGEYRNDHPPFEDFYAAPTHKVRGPHGWPSYVAKAVVGIVPVELDGSVSFTAPAGKVLYFQALDEQYNEIQRMRSVVQLQPGEKRTCIGCHENRASAPPAHAAVAARQEPRQLEAPPWGAGPFSYEKVVQPVWDAKCVRCHDANDKQKLNFAGTLDADRVPASYRTLITQGWVHHFDYAWQREHTKAAPLTFGTLKSKLWKTLNAGHYEVKLTAEEVHRIKCWIDLNCPLWTDYRYRMERAAASAAPAGK